MGSTSVWFTTPSSLISPGQTSTVRPALMVSDAVEAVRVRGEPFRLFAVTSRREKVTVLPSGVLESVVNWILATTPVPSMSPAPALRLTPIPIFALLSSASP